MKTTIQKHFFVAVLASLFTLPVYAQVDSLRVVGVTVDDDSFGGSSGDDDGKIERGESIELILDVFNYGNSNATNVEVVISTSNTNIIITDPDVSVGTIFDQSSNQFVDFDFVVNNSAIDEDVTFTASITSDQGNFTDDFVLHVTGPPAVITVETFILDDDNFGNSSGNGNGVLEAGETAELQLYFKNIGGQDALASTASVSTNHNGLSFTSNQDSLGDISPGDSVLSDPFVLVAASTIKGGAARIDYQVNGTNGVWVANFELNVIGGPATLKLVEFILDDDNFGGSDGNGNGILEAGESIEMPIRLWNAGGSEATNPFAILRCNDPDITLEDTTLIMANISSKDTVLTTVDFDFDIDPGVLDKSVTFTIRLGGSNQTWDTSIFIPVFGAPSFAYGDLEILDDGTGASIGNGNGLIEAGERIQIRIPFTNQGGVPATNLGAELNADPGFISFIDSIYGEAAVNPGDTVSSQIFVFDVLPSASTDTLNFFLDFTTDQGTFQKLFRIPVQAQPHLGVSNYIIDDDDAGSSNGNSDGDVDGGEVIEIFLEVTNSGGADASNLNVILRSLDPDVSISDSTKFLSSLNAGVSQTIGSDYDFSVSPTIQTKFVEMLVVVKADQGRWTDTLSIPVTGIPNMIVSNFTIDDDNNGNSAGNSSGTVEAGETIESDLFLKNNGSTIANGVYVKLVSKSPFVQVLVDSAFIGTVGSGVTSFSQGFLFKVDSAAPDLVSALDLHVFSDNHFWVRDLGVSLSGKVNLAYASSTIDDDAFGGSNGNGNGIPEAGESVEILIDVQNTSGGTANNVEVIFRSLSPFVSITDSLKNIGSVGGGAVKPITSDFDFNVSPNVVDGFYDFQLQLTSDEGTFLDTFQLNIQGLANLTQTGFTVDDDSLAGTLGNGNGVLGANERVNLSLLVENTGGKASTNSYVLLSTDRTDLVFLNDSVFIGSLNPGSNILQGGFILQGNPNLESGTAEIDITFGSDQGSWTETLDLPVEGIVILDYFSHWIDDDVFGSSFGNGDSIVQAGEQVEFLLTLINTGGADALNLEVILRTNSPFITITDSVKNVARIDANDVYPIASDYDFIVANNTPTGPVAFDLVMNTDQGQFTSSFNVQVTGQPILDPSLAYVVDQGAGTIGDSDSIPEAGETVAPFFFIENLGGVDATKAYALITTTDSAITLLQDSIFIGTVLSGGKDTIGPGLVQIAGDAVDQTVTLNMTFFSDQGNINRNLSFPIFGNPELIYTSHWIDDDPFSGSMGDGDSIAEAGETAELLLTIQNIGGGRARNLLATLSTSDSLITFTDSVKYLASIDAGETDEIGSDYDFIVDPSHPSQVVTFDLKLESDEGTWFRQFPIFIGGKPNLNVASFSISDDNVGSSLGNGDGIAQASETIEINLDLANIGLENATGVSVVVRPEDTLISPLLDSLFIGSVIKEDTAFAPGFVFRINPFITSGNKDMEVIITTDQGIFTPEFELPVKGQVILSFAGIVVNDDLNGNSIGDSDGIAEAGETVELAFSLENQGGATARNMNVSLWTMDTNLVLIDSLIDFHVLGSFDTVEFVKEFVVYVNPDAPTDTATMYFTVQEDNVTYTDSFLLAYTGNAVMDLISLVVDDDNVGQTIGDNDSVADYLERIALNIDYGNIGTLRATNVYAKLSTSDTLITMITDSVSLDTTEAGSFGSFEGFLFDVDSLMPYKNVDFVLEFFADEGSWANPFALRMNGMVDLNLTHSYINDDPFSGSSGDGDGIAEGGESVEIYIELANLGLGRGQDVEVRLRSQDASVEIVDSIMTFSNIFSNDTATTGQDFDVEISDTISTVRNIPFTLHANSKEGSWTFNYNLQVHPGLRSIEFLEAVFDDDKLGDSYGDGDGKIESGETIEYRIRWLNNGTVTLRNVVFAVETADDDIVMLDTAFTMSSFAASDTTFVFSDLEFQVKPNTSSKTVWFRATITADDFTDNIIFPVEIHHAHEIKVLIHPPNAGVVNGAGFIQELDTITLRANANLNFKFLNWMEQSRIISRDTFLTFVVGSSGTLVANFAQTNVGLEEEEPFTFLVYPNPASNQLNIRFSRPVDEAFQMEMYDLSGRRVWAHQSMPGIELSYNLPQLPSGSYILSVDLEGEIIRIPMVIHQD